MDDPWQHFLYMSVLDSSSLAKFGQASRHQQPEELVMQDQVNLIDFSDNDDLVSNVCVQEPEMLAFVPSPKDTKGKGGLPRISPLISSSPCSSMGQSSEKIVRDVWLSHK
jgi:hypothetical protein